MILTKEILTEKMKQLDQDLSNYAALVHQCTGALKIVQNLLTELDKEADVQSVD